MNTNRLSPRMDTNERQCLVEKELVYRVVGCAMDVLNFLGHGLREKTYHRALCVEMRYRELLFRLQSSYPVFYRDEKVDDYIPDLVVEDKMIVEIKTVETILDEHLGQVLNYLKITGLEVGIVLNFKHARLEWRRIVLQPGNNQNQTPND